MAGGAALAAPEGGRDASKLLFDGYWSCPYSSTSHLSITVLLCNVYLPPSALEYVEKCVYTIKIQTYISQYYLQYTAMMLKYSR